MRCSVLIVKPAVPGVKVQGLSQTGEGYALRLECRDLCALPRRTYKDCCRARRITGLMHCFHRRQAEASNEGEALCVECVLGMYSRIEGEQGSGSEGAEVSVEGLKLSTSCGLTGCTVTTVAKDSTLCADCVGCEALCHRTISQGAELGNSVEGHDDDCERLVRDERSSPPHLVRGGRPLIPV